MCNEIWPLGMGCEHEMWPLGMGEVWPLGMGYGGGSMRCGHWVWGGDREGIGMGP